MRDPVTPEAGRLADGEHRLPVRVYYEDTDAGGIVYHASYLRFFERGRTELLALAGAGRAGAGGGAEAGGYVVAEVALRCRAPARLGDALIVATRVVRVRSAACVVQHRVTRGTEGQLVAIADGAVTLAYVGRDGRPQRQPPAVVAVLRALLGREGVAGGADGTEDGAAA